MPAVNVVGADWAEPVTKDNNGGDETGKPLVCEVFELVSTP